jgi:CDP-2,3-bis-(O-geranylgeranyl)-sn-glycerol synthase
MGGRRVLGDGKTWRGTTVGVAAGALVAGVLNLVSDSASELLAVDVPVFPLAIVVAFPLGAMVGDIGASFLKRRTGRERGAPFPGVDQLDFVVGTLLLGLVAAPGWVFDVISVPVLAVILLLTPLLHLLTNGIAYLLGLKDEPW